MTMYAGGPGGDPSGLMALQPQQPTINQGLLQAPQTAWSQYPLTSGLLSSMAKNMGGTQPGSNSQLAYQMAGSPHMGPFASVPVPAAIPGSLDASGSNGSSSGSGLAAGLLGTLAKNPKAVSQIYGLLGGGAPSLASFGTGAAANGALAAAGIGTNAGIAGATAADSASIAAANSAWLASQPAAAGAASGAAGGAAAGTTAAGTGAASGGSGAAAGSLAGGAVGLGILAAPVIAGMMTRGVQTNAAYAQKLNDALFSNDPTKAGGAMDELLAAQNDPDNRVTITPAQQQRINELSGIGPNGQLDGSQGLLYQMSLANPLNKMSGGAPAQKGVARN